MTKIKIEPGDTVTIKVRGPAVVRVSQPGPVAPSVADHAGEQQATMAGLAEAVSLLTARVHGMASPGLSGEVPPGTVAAALVSLGGTFLAHLLPADQGAALLRDLGLAAQEDT